MPIWSSGIGVGGRQAQQRRLAYDRLTPGDMVIVTLDGSIPAARASARMIMERHFSLKHGRNAYYGNQ